MGTSRPTKGPSPSTPIVPTWSDDSDKGPIPGGDDPQPDTTEDDPSADDGQHQPEPAPRAPIKPPVLPDRFRTARSNFTRSAGSGGQDRDAMRRGIRDYVRNGTGGSGGATRRMGSARSAAAGVLGVLRSIQTDGVEAILNKFNLGDLAGQPIDQIFAGLTDVICEPGGNINDSIATDAWIETITELDQLGVDDLDSLSSEQIEGIFVSFIAHSIETRLYQDIGSKGIQSGKDTDAVRAFEAQLKDYIFRAVSDSVPSDVSSVGNLSDAEIRSVVNQTYQDAWEFLEIWGDEE